MKKLFGILSAILTFFIFSGCNSDKGNSWEKDIVLPRVTLVKYCADYDDYPDGAFGSRKQVHLIFVYTDDGKIYSAKFDGGEYQSDPAWISPGSDDWYERLTELAEGETSGSVPEEQQKLIRANYDKFSEWTALETADCGTIYDYMDAETLYVVFYDGGETRIEKLAKLSGRSDCRDSAEARKFAGEFLGSVFQNIINMG